jgi:hypothetical protein
MTLTELMWNCAWLSLTLYVGYRFTNAIVGLMTVAQDVLTSVTPIRTLSGIAGHQQQQVQFALPGTVHGEECERILIGCEIQGKKIGLEIMYDASKIQNGELSFSIRLPHLATVSLPSSFSPE